MQSGNQQLLIVERDMMNLLILFKLRMNVALDRYRRQLLIYQLKLRVQVEESVACVTLVDFLNGTQTPQCRAVPAETTRHVGSFLGGDHPMPRRT